jgi:hypothetical protein
VVTGVARAPGIAAEKRLFSYELQPDPVAGERLRRIPSPAHAGDERPAPGLDDHDVEGIPQRLEVRPLEAARELFQRAPQPRFTEIARLGARYNGPALRLTAVGCRAARANRRRAA